MCLRYRSTRPAEQVVISFKPAGNAPPGTIPDELFTRLPATADGQSEIRVPLPATPALSAVKEVVLLSEAGGPVDLAITGLTFVPNRR